MRFPKIAMTVLVLGCCLVSLKANADICTKSIMEHKMMVNITGECTFNEFDPFFTIYKENAFMQWPTKWFLPVVEGKEVPGMTFKIYATELRSDDKPGALGYQIQVRTGKNQGYTYKSKVMARDLKGQTLPEGWTEQRWGTVVDPRQKFSTSVLIEKINSKSIHGKSIDLNTLMQLVTAKHDLSASSITPTFTDLPSQSAPVIVNAETKDAVPELPLKGSPPANDDRQNSNHSVAKQVLTAPKGYDIKPAKLFSASEWHLGAERWIVARSREEALAIGRDFYSFYSEYDACFRGTNTDCRRLLGSPLELDFGWVAIIKATEVGSGGKDNVDKTFYAYRGSSRQESMSSALKLFREKQGGASIQYLYSGLVSEIQWERVKREFEAKASRTNGSLIPNMAELNYMTVCDWTDGGFYNKNPSLPVGKLEEDPACKKKYRPDEKLPEPVLRSK